MNSVSRKNGNTALYNLPSLYRGMYNRIAAKIGCDPSYVSRVARGERRSNEAAKAPRVEIQKTWSLANGNGNPNHSETRARKGR